MRNIKAFIQHIKEAVGPNYVMKTGKRPYDPPKQYLKMLDGSQFRGHMGRTYDVNEFRGISQYGVDFSGADFEGVDLTNAFFKGCSFDGCDMSVASSQGAVFIRCSFSGAWGMSSLESARLEDCTF